MPRCDGNVQCPAGRWIRPGVDDGHFQRAAAQARRSPAAAIHATGPDPATAILRMGSLTP